MKVRLATKEEWDSWIVQCPQATFFHSYDWYAIWSKYEKASIEVRMFEFAGEPKALLPLLIKKVLKGQVKTYTSSPVGTHGGFITKPNIDEKERQALAHYLKQFSFLSLYENPYDLQLSAAIPWNKKDFTQILTLDQPLENILASWSSSHRRSLKKALAADLKVEIAQEEDWPRYYQLYLESSERWGDRSLGIHDWRLFELIRQLPPEKCRLWLAKHEGQIVSGCLCFYGQEQVVYWHGASASAAFEKRPVHLLHYRIIEEALARGLKYYDFNPSGELAGVIRFKKGFGTFRQERNILEKEPSAYRLFSDAYHKWRKR